MERMTIDLTEKQARVLAHITQWIRDQRYPPTFQELAQALRLTEKNARDYVLILERKGYLRRQPNVARGITLLQQPTSESLLEVPLIGWGKGGKPGGRFKKSRADSGASHAAACRHTLRHGSAGRFHDRRRHP